MPTSYLTCRDSGDTLCPLPQTPGEVKLRQQMVPLEDIKALTKSHLHIDVQAILNKNLEAMMKAKNDLLEACSSWTSLHGLSWTGISP
jgi:antiviral helicase SKI2